MRAGWALTSREKGPRQNYRYRPRFFAELWKPGAPSLVLPIARKGNHSNAAHSHVQLASTSAHVEAVHIDPWNETVSWSSARTGFAHPDAGSVQDADHTLLGIPFAGTDHVFRLNRTVWKLSPAWRPICSTARSRTSGAAPPRALFTPRDLANDSWDHS